MVRTISHYLLLYRHVRVNAYNWVAVELVDFKHCLQLHYASLDNVESLRFLSLLVDNVVLTVISLIELLGEVLEFDEGPVGEEVDLLQELQVLDLLQHLHVLTYYEENLQGQCFCTKSV